MLITSSAKKPAAKKAAAPAKKTAAPAKKAAARPRYDDDDDDDAEAPPRSERRRARENGGREGGAKKSAANGAAAAAARSGTAKAGWREADEVFQGGEFANNLTMKDGEEIVIRFLEDQPYASLRIHWLDRKGKRSYPCPGDRKKDSANNGCPLCAYNISYKSESRFNVAVLTDEDPVVKSLTATPRTKKRIQSHADSKHGPLSRKYYFYRRTGTKFDTEYTFEVARTVNDVKEDYPGVYIPTEEELAELVLFTTEQANKEFAPLSEMRKVAAEIVSGEDEDDDE